MDSTRQVYNLGNGGVPVHHDPDPCGWDCHKPRKMTMGAAPSPILDFRGLPQSRAQGHGELGPPQACRGEAGAGSDHDGTRNMSQGVNLLRGDALLMGDDTFRPEGGRFSRVHSM